MTDNLQEYLHGNRELTSEALFAIKARAIRGIPSWERADFISTVVPMLVDLVNALEVEIIAMSEDA